MSDPSDLDIKTQILTPATGSGPDSFASGSGFLAEGLGERYEIMGMLGSGGMGSVYKVRDVVLDEVVALKTLNTALAQDAHALGRFRREVKLARRVTHPNVARTFDIGSLDSITYLTMEFIDGESLRARLDRRAEATVADVLEVMIAVCEGLQAAHDAGVVHRDLKPDNVMLARDGRVVITDFGIARAPRRRDNLQQTGVDGLIGTPQYMAPEQVEGADDIDGRADLYAAGVMLFELLSGAPPWRGDTPISIAIARLMNPPPTLSTPGVPGQLVDLVARAMSRHRDARPPSARALADALRAIATSLTHDAPAALPTPHERGALDTLDEPPHPKTTLAVLPVRNRSSEDDAHLAMGIAEELAGELAMLEGLLVKPLSASLALDASRGPQELGRQLGVRVVVDSSMRRKGDSLRVRVALISVDDGFQVWGDKFSGPVSDIFDIAEDAAEAIAAALATTHSSSARPSAPSDPIAVERYMRAKRTLARGWHHAATITNACLLFEQALDLAPEDPRVLAGLATAVSRSAFYNEHDVPVAELHARALELARRAVARAPDWADPHYALAIVSYNANDFAAAARHCVNALALHADHLDARDLLGRILAETGPLDAAIHHLTRALQLDPGLDRARMDLARAYALNHDFDTADALLDELAPAVQEIANAIRVRFQIWRGEVPSKASVVALSRFSQSPVVFTACAHYLHDETTREDLKRHLPVIAADLHARFSGSRLYLLELQLLTTLSAWAGAPDIALDAIDDLMDLDARDLMWLERTPIMIRLAEHPRYQRAVQRMRRAVASTRAVVS